MYSYEFLHLQVAERQAQVAHDFATHRLAKAARQMKPRHWLRRSVAEVADRMPVPEPQPIARVVPAPGTAGFHEWVTTLGFQLAEGGARTVETQLRALARHAKELHVESVSAGVLADRREPDVARARAFSRVVSALDAVTLAGGAELGATA